MKEYIKTIFDKIIIRTREPKFKIGDLVILKNTIYNQYVVLSSEPYVCGLVVKVPSKYNFIYFIHIPGKKKTILAYEKELQYVDDFLKDMKKRE